jgi:hypothetical protein
MEIGLGCPAIYVVKFTDIIFYIRIPDIPTSDIVIGGTTHLVQSYTDIEPLIRVPVNLFKRIQ